MRTLVLASIVLAVSLGGASAQGNEAEQREACTSDAFKFCAIDIPDRSKIERCLGEHRAKLTPACKKMIDG